MLITAAGSIELRYIMNEISYHEDLFNNCVSGYVMVTESNAYSELLSLTGNEFIQIIFSKTGEPKSAINKTFRVYSIDKRKLSQNMYTESYILQFCSEELLLSSQYKVSKAYTNTTIDSMIIDICTTNPGLNIGRNKFDQKNIDQTYGNYSFVVPNLRPFDAINWLSTYARPTPDVGAGADMLFFENKNGFNFKSIQSLFNPKVNVYNRYTYDPKNIASREDTESLTEQIKNVITYEILDTYDTLNGINTGAFANQLISADVITRKRTVTNFDYSSYFMSGNALNQYSILNNYVNRNGDTANKTSQAVMKLAFTNFDRSNNAVIQSLPNSVAPNTYAETYIPYRTAQLALINYTRLKITIPGDPNFTVGTEIEFQLSSRNPQAKGPDLYLSGNYLVSAVRHMITQADYKTVAEIVKDSVKNRYIDTPNGSSTWTKLANI